MLGKGQVLVSVHMGLALHSKLAVLLQPSLAKTLLQEQERPFPPKPGSEGLCKLIQT